MEDYPQSLLELESRFATEDAYHAYLAKLRWPSGFRCPRCGLEKAWIRSNGQLDCSNCRLQTSITARIIFQDTKTPLSLLIQFLWRQWPKMPAATSLPTTYSTAGVKCIPRLFYYSFESPNLRE